MSKYTDLNFKERNAVSLLKNYHTNNKRNYNKIKKLLLSDVNYEYNNFIIIKLLLKKRILSIPKFLLNDDLINDRTKVNILLLSIKHHKHAIVEHVYNSNNASKSFKQLLRLRYQENIIKHCIRYNNDKTLNIVIKEPHKYDIYSNFDKYFKLATKCKSKCIKILDVNRPVPLLNNLSNLKKSPKMNNLCLFDKGGKHYNKTRIDHINNILATPVSKKSSVLERFVGSPRYHQNKITLTFRSVSLTNEGKKISNFDTIMKLSKKNIFNKQKNQQVNNKFLSIDALSPVSVSSSMHNLNQNKSDNKRYISLSDAVKSSSITGSLITNRLHRVVSLSENNFDNIYDNIINNNINSVVKLLSNNKLVKANKLSSKNIIDSNNHHAIKLCILHNRYALLSYFIDKKADVSFKNYYPLLLCCIHNRNNMIKLLLNHYNKNKEVIHNAEKFIKYTIRYNQREIFDIFIENFNKNNYDVDIIRNYAKKYKFDM